MMATDRRSVQNEEPTLLHRRAPLHQLGDFQLLEQVGVGGFGAVYRAEDVRSRELCALKLIHKHQLEKADSVIRFQREAHALAALQHPNVVQLIDFGQIEPGGYYIVMEYIEGIDLGAVITDMYPLPQARMLRILRQLCEVLSYAHQVGILHRDLKPTNILLTETPEADHLKLIDFGIAAMDGHSQLTQSGTMVGSPIYMSPEQIRGNSSSVDHRADLYSLGIMVYLMLTQSPPYSADNLTGYVAHHLFTEPPTLASLRPECSWHPALEVAVRRSVAKNPDDRFPDAMAMYEALEYALRLQGELRFSSQLRQEEIETEALPAVHPNADTTNLLKHFFSGKPGQVTVQSLLSKRPTPGAGAVYAVDSDDDYTVPELAKAAALAIEAADRALASSQDKLLAVTGSELTTPELPLADLETIPMPPTTPPAFQVSTFDPSFDESLVAPFEEPLKEPGHSGLWAFSIGFVVMLSCLLVWGWWSTSQKADPPHLSKQGANSAKTAPGQARSSRPLSRAAQAPKQLRIATKPTGALVFVDGKQYCTTPCTYVLRGTARQLLIRRTGFSEVLFPLQRPLATDQVLFTLQPKETSPTPPRAKTRALSRTKPRVRKRRRHKARRKKRRRVAPKQRRRPRPKRRKKVPKRRAVVKKRPKARPRAKPRPRPRTRTKDDYNIGDPLYDLGKK